MDPTSGTSASTAPHTEHDIESLINPTIGNASSSSSSKTVSDTPTGADPSSSSRHNPPGSKESSSSEDYKKKRQSRLDLFNAALKGDSNRAKFLIGEDRQLLKEEITELGDTFLHVAAGAKQTVFVQDMINFMKQNMKEEIVSTLDLTNKNGHTAFCLAAMAGSVPIAKAMRKEHLNLLKIQENENEKPLYLAALYGQKDMAQYLYEEMMMNEASKNELEIGKNNIFIASIDTTLYDLALKLLQHHDPDGELAMINTDKNQKLPTPLHRLAQTPLHLLGQTGRSDKTASLDQALELIERLWEKILSKESARNYLNKVDKHLLFDAARLGNFKFLEKLISLYPDLVLQTDEGQRTIFHIAIMYRHDNLFDLIYNIGFNKQLIAGCTDKDGNTLLHLAATYLERSPDRKKPGAALEMQRELEIFKDVELIVMPSLRESKNKKGETPREIFTLTHAKLVEQGEKWMRDTASQCMLVGTLIATVIFSAAFTTPGGTDDKEGIPIHWRNFTFQIFAIADEIALSLSCISIIMFLSILTSRYAENDFYRSLPRKLVGGLLSLSMSIASMMVAFISSFFLAYNHQRSNVIPNVGTILVFMPVVVFVWSQYGLLRDILY